MVFLFILLVVAAAEQVHLGKQQQILQKLQPMVEVMVEMDLLLQ
jgi:hypothetical protein